MPEVLTSVVDAIVPPSAEQRADAASAEATQAVHCALMRDWPCLQTIEHRAPPHPHKLPRTLTVAAWNMERCKRVECSADLLRHLGADIVLASEMDIGMARSGQRHTPRDLAAELGFGYVFATEFVELGTGDAYETQHFAGVANDQGLHGNAVLSRYPLRNPSVIPLEATGHWFTGSPKSDGQRRVGRRMAIAAEIETASGPVAIVAVHYESASSADDRLVQTRELLAGISEQYSETPVVVGGDLNTADLAGQTAQTCLSKPGDFEPSFMTYEEAGYDWRAANDGTVTTRAAPGRKVEYPLKRLDWLFARGLSAATPRTLPAVSMTGEYLSDHEIIIAQFVP